MQLADAERLLAAVREHAGRDGLRLSAAVVDERGLEVALVRMDGASWFTPAVARTKAATAAWFARPSADLAAMRGAHPEVFRIAGRQLPQPPTDLPGGLPVYDATGALIGALGVSGATPEQDVATARAAIEASGHGDRIRATQRDDALVSDRSGS